MSTGVRLVCAYTLLLAVVLLVFVPSHNVFAEGTPLPAGVLLDNSASDQEWSIGMSNGGHYVNIFGGYDSLGNPPVYSSEHAWVAPGDVVWVRVKVAGSSTCAQLERNGTGLTLYGPTMTAYGAMYIDKPGNGSYCDFVLAGSGVPAGTKLSAVYFGSNNALVTGSSHNLGTSLNGSNEDAIDGGFAFQLCGMDGCSGGFASTTVPVEEPVATTTEPVATTTEPVATTTPVVPADTAATADESQHRPHSSYSPPPVVITPVSVATPVLEALPIAQIVPTVRTPIVQKVHEPPTPQPVLAPVIVSTPSVEQPSVPLSAPVTEHVPEPKVLSASAYNALPQFVFLTFDVFRSLSPSRAVALSLLATIALLAFAFIHTLFRLLSTRRRVQIIKA